MLFTCSSRCSLINFTFAQGARVFTGEGKSLLYGRVRRRRRRRWMAVMFSFVDEDDDAARVAIVYLFINTGNTHAQPGDTRCD